MKPSAEAARAIAAGEGPRVAVDERLLTEGWEVACASPAGAEAAAPPTELDWLPAQVPGTAASALRRAGRWDDGDERDFDAFDWWFRLRFEEPPATDGERVVLCFDGIATVAEVRLDGEPLLSVETMFGAHAVDVSDRIGGRHELTIRCRALAPLLTARRRPRARWRTRVASDGNLRFFRTALLGRAPGFAPGPAPVGPWRPVRVERRRRLTVERLALLPRLDGDDGLLRVEAIVRPHPGATLGAVAARLGGPSGDVATTLADRGPTETGARRLDGELRVPRVARWWPHTHGEPTLHEVVVEAEVDGELLRIGGRPVGFRALGAGARADHELERDGLDLHVNGVRLFARGVVWTPVDAVRLSADPARLRAALELLRDGGVNLLRLPGIGVYEQERFYALCDELGLLLWQDAMFANFDYPIADPAFRAAVELEAEQLFARLAGRPAVAVVCGNSEVEQQVAMLGLDPALGRGELFGTLLPQALARAGGDAIWVPSSPCGGTLPFRPGAGIANYYGVGGYRRPLEDARRAGVRFAAECLAFANVPDEAALAELGTPAVHEPRWKAGVPRDAGSGWDFDDVRDHYLAALFALDPGELRRVDQTRYLELSRAAGGETMAEVFGEWRRRDSGCGGGLVMWAHDLRAGAGWGVIDHRGRPKEAYHHLRRLFAPLALWTVDEGLGGIAVHVANDGPRPLRLLLRVRLLRDLEHEAGGGEELLELPPHGGAERDAEALVGHFADASWSYRFGPPAADALVASLHDEQGALLAQAVRFPAGRPLRREPAAGLGLEACERTLPSGERRLTLSARRLVYGLRLHAPGWLADDDAFSLAPGAPRDLTLRPLATADGGAVGDDAVVLSALNLDGRVRARKESA